MSQEAKLACGIALFLVVMAALSFTVFAEEDDNMMPGTNIPYRNDMQKYGTYPQP